MEAGTKAFIEWWENAARLLEDISLITKNTKVPIKKILVRFVSASKYSTNALSRG